MDDDKEYAEMIKERFSTLPKVVQRAIISAEIEKHMRELASTYKLHLDQWETLENEVQLTLLGIQASGDLESNIKKELGVSDEVAKSLTADISKIVFEPIRAELERELAQPSSQAPEATPVPAAPAAPAAPPVLPATPPAEAPTGKIERAPVSESYKAGETSVARKSVHDDPYREPPA